MDVQKIIRILIEDKQAIARFTSHLLNFCIYHTRKTWAVLGNAITGHRYKLELFSDLNVFTQGA